MSEPENTEKDTNPQETIQELNRLHQTLPNQYQYDEILLDLLSDVTNLGNYQVPDYQSYMNNGETIFNFQQKWIRRIPQLLEFYDAQPKPRQFDIQLEVCCLCLEAEPSVILEPCGHLLVCVPCIKKLFQTNERYRSRCPMCRTDIDLAICFKTNEYIDPIGERSRPVPPTDYYSSNSSNSEESTDNPEDDNVSGGGGISEDNSEDDDFV